jgi:hypothetical protein
LVCVGVRCAVLWGSGFGHVDGSGRHVWKVCRGCSKTCEGYAGGKRIADECLEHWLADLYYKSSLLPVPVARSPVGILLRRLTNVRERSQYGSEGQMVLEANRDSRRPHLASVAGLQERCAAWPFANQCHLVSRHSRLTYGDVPLADTAPHNTHQPLGSKPINTSGRTR